ncbi:MAG: ATP-binding cassette domain-containing protein [Marine Group I thaumarchaeote]|nr:MAG: ATP-binding cassette domain-containing protein [Marine Group I thaumarchaeote]
MYAIETKSLSKIYNSGLKAIDKVSIKVEEGEIFGFLGPNGAGKSTTIMILTTLLKLTSGSAYVSGYNVASQAKKVRQNIGYVQQEITADEYLSARENLQLQARLYHMPKELTQKRIDEVLDLVELSDRQNDAVITYSGGMRKRLDIAGGLLHRPKVLFLDEPTLGLDIQTRFKIWDYIKKIHQEFGMSIFLTTHYMEEADRLCETISIVDYGKIKVTNSPISLKQALGNERVVFSVDADSKKEELLSRIRKIDLVSDITINGKDVTVFSSKGSMVIPLIFEISSNLEVQINSISQSQPTLDDVFLSYTGRDLRDEPIGDYDRGKKHEKMRWPRS